MFLRKFNIDLTRELKSFLIHGVVKDTSKQYRRLDYGLFECDGEIHLVVFAGVVESSFFIFLLATLACVNDTIFKRFAKRG